MFYRISSNDTQMSAYHSFMHVEPDNKLLTTYLKKLIFSVFIKSENEPSNAKKNILYSYSQNI